jgi:hypothetical protein
MCTSCTNLKDASEQHAQNVTPEDPTARAICKANDKNAELHATPIRQNAAPLSGVPSIWDMCYSKTQYVRKVLSEDKSNVGRLDYALFLYAFINSPNSERNAMVKQITDELVAKARAAVTDKDAQRLFTGKTSFDGTYKSLVSVLRILSCSGIVNTHSSFYAIPAPVLQGRPELLEATRPYFHDDLDVRLPRCGFWYGRGHISFFPKDEVESYCRALRELSEKAPNDRARIRELCERLALSPWDFTLERGKLRCQYAERCYNCMMKCRECEIAFEKANAALGCYFSRFKFDGCNKENAAKNALLCLADAYGVQDFWLR